MENLLVNSTSIFFHLQWQKLDWEADSYIKHIFLFFLLHYSLSSSLSYIRLIICSSDLPSIQVCCHPAQLQVRTAFVIRWQLAKRKIISGSSPRKSRPYFSAVTWKISFRRRGSNLPDQWAHKVMAVVIVWGDPLHPASTLTGEKLVFRLALVSSGGGSLPLGIFITCILFLSPHVPFVYTHLYSVLLMPEEKAFHQSLESLV